jgi:hypothetical protein
VKATPRDAVFSICILIPAPRRSMLDEVVVEWESRRGPLDIDAHHLRLRCKRVKKIRYMFQLPKLQTEKGNLFKEIHRVHN